MTTRKFNFSAGPATLPLPVLEQIKEELFDWHGLGASVMEISHRGAPFEAFAQEFESDLRSILSIPDNYQILFMHGGGRGQFAALPLNLMSHYPVSDYVLTGIWSRLAAQEAEKFCKVNQVASSESEGYASIPDRASWRLSDNAAYCHIVTNETVNGVEFRDFPDVGKTPLIADMSSNILSRPIDVSKTALIYAGSQKNMGPAGMTLVIIREDLLERSPSNIPSVLNYQLHAQTHSMANTPGTFTWYVCYLVLQWLKHQGGLAAIAKINDHKAQLLYDVIDSSGFYVNRIDPNVRSRMNVVFKLPDEVLTARFLKEAEAAGLTNLKGHKVVGGVRASIYNAMPLEGVQALVDFMQQFVRQG